LAPAVVGGEAGFVSRFAASYEEATLGVVAILSSEGQD